MTVYRVHLGGRRYRRFTDLVSAREFCNRYFQQTGVVLSVVESQK